VLASAPVHPLFFRDEQVYCLEPSLPVRQFCDSEGLRANVIPDPEDFLRLGAFVKALCIGHPRDLAVVRADLADALGGDARLVRTAGTYLEILPVAATKGAALTCLAAHLGVPLARVVAVGDQDNDIEMLAAVGVGLAMPHAPDEVRAVAGHVARAPEDGGLLGSLGELMPQYFG
jgi:hydroxymethylpyrimidine pyrophosphatase-like HAD family hydrolase